MNRLEPQTCSGTPSALSAVHSRGTPAPGRQAGLLPRGFRRGLQQVGNNHRLGSRAQDVRWALGAAQGHRARGPHADGGDQGFG